MSLCLYMLEGTVEDAFPLESPLTIYHSRRMKGGSELAVEVVMGEKAIWGRPRAGSAPGECPWAERSPLKWVGKPRGQRVQPQRKRWARSPRGGQPSSSEPPGAQGHLRWPGGLVGGG